MEAHGISTLGGPERMPVRGGRTQGHGGLAGELLGAGGTLLALLSERAVKEHGSFPTPNPRVAVA
jgi:hypothetical protein